MDDMGMSMAVLSMSALGTCTCLYTYTLCVCHTCAPYMCTIHSPFMYICYANTYVQRALHYRNPLTVHKFKLGWYCHCMQERSKYWCLKAEMSAI